MRILRKNSLLYILLIFYLTNLYVSNAYTLGKSTGGAKCSLLHQEYKDDAFRCDITYDVTPFSTYEP